MKFFYIFAPFRHRNMLLYNKGFAVASLVGIPWDISYEDPRETLPKGLHFLGLRIKDIKW